ncbi:MAG: hypothetical protein ACYC9X_12030 [Dehalococcoidia bacterium]
MLTTPGGTGSPDTVRRLSVPRPLRVEAGGDGTPRRVCHRGRWRAVTQVRDRYRTDDRWWTGAPVVREYFDLLLEDGWPLTVYRDRLAGRWYAH